tara:strand:+ start:4078 stop:4404 length:327 start_codon:yes stop_codon:yes gene_type:complete
MAVIWAVSSTERETTNNGITAAHWIATDSEDVGTDPVVTHLGSNSGVCSFTPNHDSDDFISYADITEADVVGWIKASFGADEVSEVETSVATQIADSKAPPIAYGVPW